MAARGARNVRSNIVRAYWAKCRTELFALLSLLFGGILLSFFAVFVFDYMIRFPWPVRLLLTLAILGVFCVYLPMRNREIIFARRRSLLHVARFIENCATQQKQGGFRSVLVSAIEFGGKGRFPGSAELQKRVVNDARGAKYNPSRLCLHDKVLVKRSRRTSAPALVVYALWAVIGANSLVTFHQRAFGLSVDYLTTTQIVELNHPRCSARYKDIEVLVKAGGEIPSRGEMRVEFRNEPPFTVPLEAVGVSNIFKGVISRPAKHVAFAVRLGDARSSRRKIRVVREPFVKGARIRITPPKYTRQKPYRVELGDVELLENSILEMTVQTDRRLKFCILEAGDKIHYLRWKEGAYVLEKKRIPSSRRYSIKLVDKYEIENEDRLYYNMTVIKDQLPRVAILSPEEGSYYAPISALNWRVKASDDFRLSEGNLTYTVSRPNEQGDVTAIKDGEIHLEPGRGQRDVVLADSVSLLELGVEAGMQVAFKVDMWDSNTFRKPDECGESEVKTIHVVTPEELRSIIEEELLHLGKTIDDLKGDMEYQEAALGRR